MEPVAKHNCSHGFTKVIFRKYRNNGDILALFPEVPADCYGKYCQSYEHVGQHGAADYHHCIRITIAAKPAEFADLKTELESRGYCLQIMKRATQRDHNNRYNYMKILNEELAK